jgi:hypothetical protein
MRKLLLVCACSVLFAVGAFAQKAEANKKFEAYFGYSYFTSGKNGWNGDLGYYLTRLITAEGDVGGYYSHNNSIHSFMGGAKFQGPYRRRGFNPWGHFLLGVSHVSRLNESSDTAFSYALGGGVDAHVYRRFGVRLSADAVHTSFNNSFLNSGDWHLRAGAGVVYRF